MALFGRTHAPTFDELLQVAPLSEPARQRLRELHAQGITTDIYVKGDDWWIEVHVFGPHYECRWSPIAWETWCRGEHYAVPYPYGCQCKTCQDNRQGRAAQGAKHGEVA